MTKVECDYCHEPIDIERDTYWEVKNIKPEGRIIKDTIQHYCFNPSMGRNHIPVMTFQWIPFRAVWISCKNSKL